MIDFLFQMGLSNAFLSLVLAIVAMVAGAKARRPHLAHMLWLLVFIKLMTPPVMRIPIITIPVQGETAVVINDNSRIGALLPNSRQLNIDEQPDASVPSELGFSVWNCARVWLPPIWLLGSMVVFGFSMIRVCRFGRLLAAEAEVAPQQLQTEAEKIARRLRLKTIPIICTTSARISPMVWWAGGKVRIVIPTALLEKMDAHEWQWILAHELAHVRRHDHMIRWLEWLACVFFWWNPVVWWAQRNLRATEEICCDEMVISSLNPKPKCYADSLLSAVEYLASPVFRPPAMASEINSGGFLERRFKMIISNKSKQSNTRRLQVCILLFAVVVLPFGIAAAQDYEAVERRLGEGVAKGELTLKQASIMLDALRKAGSADKDQGADRAKAYLMKVKKELGDLVEAGKISKEAAARRYEGAEKRVKERMAAYRRQRGERGITVEEYRSAEAKMRKMVEEGKANPEDVERRLIEMRRMIGRQAERGARSERERGERRITVEEYRSAEAKMRKMIEDGKAKPKDVERRLIEMRKMIGRQRERGAERDDRERGDRSERERGERRITREDFARAEAELKKLVDEGKISQEDAKVRLGGMRRMIAAQADRGTRKDVDWEGIKRRIEAAVEAGKMTREEAKEKLEDYKKRIGR